MGQSFSDRHDETQYFVMTNKSELGQSNFIKLKHTIYFFGVIYVVFLIFSYVSIKDFALYPSCFIVPFILLGFWKATDVFEKRPDLSFGMVRMFAGAFYLAVFAVTTLIDVQVHSTGALPLVPLALVYFAAVYVDYFLVILFFNVLAFVEFLVIYGLFRGTEDMFLNAIMVAVAIVITAYGYWNVLCEYTDKGSEERILKEEGTTDLLTGLLNKMSFEKEANEYIHRRNRNEMGALLIIDFDNFKNVNDNHGHLVGDAILKKFGHILKTNFRANDIVGRVGGDEFMVMMTGTVPHSVIEAKCDIIQHELNISKIGEAGGFSCSIGVAEDIAGFKFDALYKLADDALYEAKARGKKQFVIWQTHDIQIPDKTIVYIATPDTGLREKIKKVLGHEYVYMESETASKALNEISLYQEYLESVFFDYNMPDMPEEILHKYINSRPIFSRVPMHDVAKEL